MNNGNRPHSRRKTVGSGSVSVGKGRKVNTGSGSVGFGGRSAGQSASDRSVAGKVAASLLTSALKAKQSANRPNGFGGQTGGSVFHAGNASSGTPFRTGSSSRRGSGKLSFKTILILIVLAFLVISAMKFLGGGTDSATDYAGSYGNEYSDSYGSSNSYSNNNYNSYGSSANSYGSNYGSSANTYSGSYGSSANSYGNNYNSDSYGSDYSTDYNSAASDGSAVSASTSTGAGRAHFYTPAAGDSVTVMVYMCGTDLESRNGMATKDLNEMLYADLSDKVNVIVETGGCKRWNNNTISSSANQIYKVDSDGLARLENNFGSAAMTDPDNLSKFIRYCSTNFPADRNILIFWDHGGGSVSGYGYDEKYPNSGSMTLSKIDTALKNGGCRFDFIGFDACLMATLETDIVCSDYADYMVASEETEPGTGWYYTDWLTRLSQNTAMPTVELSRTIIDGFVNSCRSFGQSAQVTLSVVDLAELDRTVPDALKDFAVSTCALIDSDSYKRVSDARAGARQFAQSSRINQIDLIDFAQRIGTKEANALAEALGGCVKYNRSTISRSNGISMYFPYESTKTVNSALSTFDAIGADSEYEECIGEYARCIQSFASLEYGGQIAASASQVNSASYASSGWGGLLDSLIGGGFGSSSYGSSYGSSSYGSSYGSSSHGSSYGSSYGSASYGSAFGSSPYSSTSPIEALTGAFSSGSAGYGMDISSILNLLGGFSGRSMPAESAWVDTDLIADKAQDIAEQFVDPSRLKATTKNGRSVLQLSDAEWANIQNVELNVFADDGEGFIDLGLDNTFDWLDDESLLLEYDGTWLTLNGKVCAYYLVSDTQQDDGSWVTVGRIPALLNGQTVNLQVVFDDANPDGVVTGAYPLYADSAIDVQAKGDIAVNAGDSIELLCDYYDLDGNYSATYSLGETFTVPASGLKLTNLAIEADDLSVAYRLTDIYGNHFWVPVN